VLAALFAAASLAFAGSTAGPLFAGSSAVSLDADPFSCTWTGSGPPPSCQSTYARPSYLTVTRPDGSSRRVATLSAPGGGEQALGSFTASPARVALIRTFIGSGAGNAPPEVFVATLDGACDRSTSASAGPLASRSTGISSLC
jgi:hypothetical protein